MGLTVGELIAEIEMIAPSNTAADWDNVGLQVGELSASVSGAVLCLEVTEAVVAEAVQTGANLIVAHHPLIFSPLSAIRTDQPLGALIQEMLRQEIALFVAHTNLDAAPRIGTAAVLADLLGVESEGALIAEGEVGYGCLGNVAGGLALAELTERVRERLSPARITVVGATDSTVRRLALMPGSGGDAVGAAAAAGADALVCGDLKHHDAIDALALGLTVIDATHYATEHPVLERLAGHLNEVLTEPVSIRVSAVVTDPFADSPQ